VTGRVTRSDRVDAAFAGLVALVATVATLSGNYDEGPEWLVVVTGLLLTLPLALRRRYPIVEQIPSRITVAYLTSGTTLARDSNITPLDAPAAHTCQHLPVARSRSRPHVGSILAARRRDPREVGNVSWSVWVRRTTRTGP